MDNIRKPIVDKVTIANDEKLKVNHVGDIRCKIGENGNKITLSGVHYIPKISVNLLSVSQIVKSGFTVVFDINGVQICKGNTTVASRQLFGNMFKMNVKMNEFAGAANTTRNQDLVLWHRRMAHVNFATLRSLLNIQVKSDLQCVVCAEGKHARKSFNNVATRATGILDLVHTEVCGPMQTRSLGHARYFVTFIDDLSRKVFAYPMKSKGEVFNKFVEFKNRVENETERKIKTLRSDNETEYENNNFQQFFAKHGIKHEKTAPFTPQQNGLAERMNRTIVEKVRCMLIDAGLSKQFWSEAVCTAVNIINVIPCASTSKAPNEVWSKKPCNMKLFRIFGCKAMVWLPNEKRKKLDPKSYPCVMLGYAENAKAYRLYDMQTKKIVISRVVIFMENENMIVDSAVSDNSLNILERIILGDDEEDSVEIIALECEGETIASGENAASSTNESTVSQNVSSAEISESNENDLSMVSVNNNVSTVTSINTHPTLCSFYTK